MRWALDVDPLGFASWSAFLTWRTDANFIGGADKVRYSVDTAGAQGPFQVEVELRFQPIAYRWAHNLEKYDAPEPKRFVGYYNEYSSGSSVQVAHAAVTVR